MKALRLIVDYYKSQELYGGVQSVFEQIGQLDPKNSRSVSLRDAEKALGFEAPRRRGSIAGTSLTLAKTLAGRLVGRGGPILPILRELMTSTTEEIQWAPFENVASLLLDSYLKAYEELFGPQLIIRNSLVGNLIPLRSKQICVINDNNVSGPELLFRRGRYDLREFFGHRYGYSSLQLLSARCASTCVVPSSSVQKDMSNYGINTRVIHHGIDTHFFKPLEKEPLREKYGFPGGTVACWVGSTHPIKGFDYVRKLAKDFPEITFILVFKHPSHLRSERNVRVVGPCDRSKLRELYNVADFYISTSIYESFGLCTMEAASCNTPIVSLRTGALKDIDSDELGCVVDEWDIGEYQKAIKTMMLRHNDFSPRLVVEKELGLEKWQTQWRELISGVEKTG